MPRKEDIMKKAAIFTMILVAVAFITVSATIINVPDDYETIQEGIAASSDGDTVLVQPGFYQEHVGFNGHNIVLGSLFLTTEDTAYIAETRISGDSSGTVVSFSAGEDTSAVLTGFTIENGADQSGGGIYCGNSSSPTIMSNIIMDNHAIPYTGGGIWCRASKPRIIGNIIRDNTAESGGGGISLLDSNPLIMDNVIFFNSGGTHGGGILCVQSNPVILNNNIYSNYAPHGGGIGCTDSYPFITGNIINGNVADYAGGISFAGSDAILKNNVVFSNLAVTQGGGINCHESNPLIENNIIYGNESETIAGGIYCAYFSSPLIINGIFRANIAQSYPEIFVDTSSSITITYSDIQGGWEGEGNIDVDPLLRDPENGDFHLKADSCGDVYNSPCIDAGHPDILDSMHGCSWGLGELRSDMGAYGGGDSVQVGIDDQGNRVVNQFTLLQNYPNPFNELTIILYSLPTASNVTIEIYDILGRRVETLISENQPAGYHQIFWNAANKPSGMYFYQLQANECVETRRLVLLK